MIDRDLSWLSFNRRILQEAGDSTVPLYERIKFLAIYSSNLDEFFRVRVAAIRSLAGLGKKRIQKELEFDPKLLLKDILSEVNDQLDLLGRTFRNDILTDLKEQGIRLYHRDHVLKSHKREVTAYFKSHVLAGIQPVFFEDSPHLFLENNNLYLILELQNPEIPDKLEYAQLRIPEGLPRFRQLSRLRGKDYIIFIDDIIRENLSFVFPDHLVLNCYSIKLNRDQDVALEKKISEHIVDRVKKQLEKRKVGVPTRFLYDQQMPDHMLTLLSDKLGLKAKELVAGGRYHNMNDLMKLPNPKAPLLETPGLQPVALRVLDQHQSLFDAMDEQDRMLHFPYQSYDYILRLFSEAAIDPKVISIRATLYRIAANSVVGQALISAAKNGKKVEVFVELKARFDEANNIRWAKKMEEAGVKVTYSLKDLKVHAKVALIQRVTERKTKSYAFFGTGNFNESTAGIYADHGLLTAHKGMCKELNQVFEYLQHGQSISKNLKHLLVARFNMQKRFLRMIDREIEHVKNGKEGQIIIKLNNLEEETMIVKLYEASQAGVKIDLIIRGICRLKPQTPGLSENIRAIRIVDGYLEHARIFKFANNGDPELYLSSADWMGRNLHRRIEVGFPIYDDVALEELNEMLNLQLADNTKARLLDENLQHIPMDTKRKKVRSQNDFHQYLKQKEAARKGW
ncbi:MAG: polyphosphate kinase 1 [Roseivirga sp.]|nr:polyphosphate kinase 1 [Roseivirga sp.]